MYNTHLLYGILREKTSKRMEPFNDRRTVTVFFSSALYQPCITIKYY